MHRSTLYSDSAVVEKISNNLRALGNVIVVSDSGLTLKTNKLFWDHQYKLVISNDSVEFTTREKDTLYGLGFESDMDLSRAKVLKPHGIGGK